MAKPKKPQYRMTALKMTAIAGVDNPAQRPALAVAIMKRDTSTAPTDLKKDGYLTSETDGHVHLWDDGRQAGCTSSAVTSTGVWHDHPYVIAEDGTVTVGAAYGHTHEASNDDSAEEPTKRNASGPEATGTTKNDTQENTMPTELETAQSTIAKNQAVIKHLMAVVALTAVHKAHYDALPESERETFVNMTSASRDLEVKKAEEANPVVYTATDGSVFRKSDDPRLINAIRKGDESEKAAQEAARTTANLQIQKRANDPKEGIPHLCKTEEGRAALYAAANAIADETLRKDALAGLRAGELAVAGGFTELGSGGGGEPLAGEAQLQKMAETRAAAEKIPVALAYSKNLEDNSEARAIVAGMNRARLRTV